jgi:hypothetical protein
MIPALHVSLRSPSNIRRNSPIKSSDGLHFAARSAKSDVSPTFGNPGMSSRYPLPVSIDRFDIDLV